jgi:E3 ubiquitin-protein ligase TRIP12
MSFPFQFVPIASFIGSILSSKDQPTLVICALQLVELLLIKAPNEYKLSFRREGVLHELELHADQELPSKVKTEPADAVIPPPASAQPLQALPGLKKLSSLSLDPQDAIVLRARVIRFKYYTAGDAPMDAGLDQLNALVAKIANPSGSEEDYRAAFGEAASLFASPSSSLSSFEFMKSGLLDAMLDFATADRSR